MSFSRRSTRKQTAEIAIVRSCLLNDCGDFNNGRLTLEFCAGACIVWDKKALLETFEINEESLPSWVVIYNYKLTLEVLILNYIGLLTEMYVNVLSTSLFLTIS